MKKLFFIVISLLAITSFSASAQSKPSIMKAKSLAFAETPNFESAKEIAQDAIAHSELNKQAKTWFTAAEIYIQSAIKTGANAEISAGKDIVKAYEYLLKAYELDLLPNAKGKVQPKYTSKIAELFVNNIYRRYILVNYGIKEAENSNYENAFRMFVKHLDIANLPVVMESKNPIRKDTTYYEIVFFAGDYAYNAGLMNDAELNYKSLKGKGYKEVAVYERLTLLSLEQKDTANYVSTLQEAVIKFPKEIFFLASLINYYVVDVNQLYKAKEYVEKAIENDPNNSQYYVILCGIYEESKDIENAMINVDKAISLNANNHDAWNAKGRLIYNKAAAIDTKAGMERDLKKADELLAEAKKLYKESIPFFEKAVELNNDNYEYLRNLRSLYYRFIDENPTYPEKYQKIDQIIKNK